MKKKLLALFAASAVLLASGCSNEVPESTAAAPSTTAEQTTTTEQTTAATTTAEESSSADDDAKAPENVTKGLSMTVNGSDGKMTITRAPKKSTPMGDADTWTIFVYLCGTDLESGGYGAATSDVIQMLDAKGSDNVKFVIQTGGTGAWMNNAFDASVAERYVIQNEDIELADTVSLTNMGDPDTLADFLDWGVRNYPAEKMGVVFWDHGGGSISGACFDELNYYDSLSLAEINYALSDVYAGMTDKFEFVGFDCCLMGTAETANVLATYARYFYGSQESEPGSGWDYTSIGTFLANDPSADGATLGKELTDSFYNECAAVDQESGCTFTIVDLEKFDDFTTAFNDYAKALPDGQLLPTYIADYSTEFIIYTSPINLNGKRTNLRIKQVGDNISIEGAWDGIGENGAAAREIKELRSGDKIVPIFSLSDGSRYTGGEYVWNDGDDIRYAYLPPAEYYYGFEIDDIYGDYYISDIVSFYVNEDGSLSYSE